MAEPTWAIVADYAQRLDAAEKAATAEHQWWLSFVALLPYAVPVERLVTAPATRVFKIPAQRTGREVDLWPRAVIQDRAPSRFIDTRNT